MEEEMSELIQRVLTGSALALVTLWLVFNSTKGFTIFIAVGGLIVGYEFIKLSKMHLTSFWILLIVATLITTSMWVTSDGVFELLLLFSLFFWLKNLFLVLNYPNKKPKNTEFRKATNLFLLLTPFIFLTFLQENKDFLLLLLFIVWGADSFAYFSGKSFGKRKLVPKLSGGKTIEGVAGGLIGVLIITGMWMFFTGNLDWKILPIALITAVFSIVGDLYESIYKREAGTKDSGNILPGHGGLFDRLDGLLAATPVFMLGTHLLGMSLA